MVWFGFVGIVWYGGGVAWLVSSYMKRFQSWTIMNYCRWGGAVTSGMDDHHGWIAWMMTGMDYWQGWLGWHGWQRYLEITGDLNISTSLFTISTSLEMWICWKKMWICSYWLHKMWICWEKMWICLYISTSFFNISSSLGLDVKSLSRLKSISVALFRKAETKWNKNPPKKG